MLVKKLNIFSIKYLKVQSEREINFLLHLTFKTFKQTLIFFQWRSPLNTSKQPSSWGDVSFGVQTTPHSNCGKWNGKPNIPTASGQITGGFMSWFHADDGRQPRESFAKSASPNAEVDCAVQCLSIKAGLVGVLPSEVSAFTT